MSKAIITESALSAIADAIRAKLGDSAIYRPGDMPAAIAQISGAPALQSLTVTSNGEYTPSGGYDGFDSVTVNVQSGGLDGVYSPSFIAQVDSWVDGGIVVHGRHAAMTVRLNNIANKQTSTPIGTVPSAIKPAGIVYLRLGNGGNTGMSLGKITPDGDIYLTNTSLGGSYAYTYAEWDIPDSAVDLVVNDSTVVTSAVGKIAVIGDMCTLCCEMTLAGSNGWANNIFSIPASVAPPSTFTPCGVFCKDPYMTGSSMSPETKDSVYSAETRGFNLWLPNGSNKGVFRACWPKGT